MKTFNFEDVSISDKEYKAIKKAARRKDRVIQSPPDSLSPSSGLCYWENTESDNMGGYCISENSPLILSENGLEYVKCRKKKTRLKWLKITWDLAKFLIPVIISVIALIMSAREQ